MIKAIIKNGVIVPRDPLPTDWQEGTEVEVEKTASNCARENGVHPTDAWMDEVERSAALQDPADDLRLQAALQDLHRREKDLARKRLGMEP
jgi:hypothetical protein